MISEESEGPQNALGLHNIERCGVWSERKDEQGKIVSDTNMWAMTSEHNHPPRAAVISMRMPLSLNVLPPAEIVVCFCVCLLANLTYLDNSSPLPTTLLNPHTAVVVASSSRRLGRVSWIFE
jgi:hypothetical protein